MGVFEEVIYREIELALNVFKGLAEWWRHSISRKSKTSKQQRKVLRVQYLLGSYYYNLSNLIVVSFFKFL